jgi:hypothetical protein
LLWFLAVETCSIWFAFVVSLQFVVIPLMENLSATQRKFIECSTAWGLDNENKSFSVEKYGSWSWTTSPVCYAFWLLTIGFFFFSFDNQWMQFWVSSWLWTALEEWTTWRGSNDSVFYSQNEQWNSLDSFASAFMSGVLVLFLSFFKQYFVLFFQNLSKGPAPKIRITTRLECFEIHMWLSVQRLEVKGWYQIQRSMHPL